MDAPPAQPRSETTNTAPSNATPVSAQSHQEETAHQMPWSLHVGLIKVRGFTLCPQCAALTGSMALDAADVSVQHLQAQHLPKKDLLGSVDPYCVLRLGNEERKSSTIKKNYNPEWKEDFVFNITDEKEELVVTLYDWDRTSKDDLIGCARVKVPDYLALMRLLDWLPWFVLACVGVRLVVSYCPP